MKSFLFGFGVLAVIAILLGATTIGKYNQITVQDQAVNTSWAAVETQMQRRFDLVPQLVGAVKGILRQEQAVFGAIAEARTHYANAKETPGTNDDVQATNQYEGALARLMIVMENYPELKSQENVTALMNELAGTENRISVVRDRYNEQVREYNVLTKQFPMVLFAKMFNFAEHEMFKSAEQAATAPNVDLEV